MSDLVLPPFNGFAFDRKRNPELKTSIKTTASGREVRQRLSAYPLWYFVLPIGVLANNRASTEYDELQGFFLSHNGQLDTWLYDCPNYNTATEQYLGTGNAARVSFQLKITHRHGFIEPTHYPKANPQIYIDDVLQESGYTVSSSGLITFTTPPATDAVVRWTGGYYHRCRFNTDLPDLTEASDRLFEWSDFGFVGSPVDKL